jgi:SAM-dependent methyltransferase
MEVSVVPSRAAPASLSRISWNCCAACGTEGGRDLVRLEEVPSNSCLMLPTADAARAWPRGEIALRLCEACGFIANRAIDPRLTEYSERYEPTQGWSPAFRRYHQALAERIAAAVPLAGRRVVEVGCGQGEFLHLLCGLAGAEGVGFDPCLDEKRGDVVAARARNIELIGEFFDDAAAERLQADLLVCKMTLEHIPAVGHFAGLCARVARNSAPGMHLFIQVPDSLRILRDIAFEDVYYEHCNYFTEASLLGLFARHGFRKEAVYRDYDGQYLGLLARFVGGAAPAGWDTDVADVARLAKHYGQAQPATVARWRRQIQDAGRVVVWGSGSKGVAFLAALGDAAALVTHAVDINPHRQGMYMIGTGHPIIGPDELRVAAPDTVVVMNRVYRDEVRAMLDALGLSPRLLLL